MYEVSQYWVPYLFPMDKWSRIYKIKGHINIQLPKRSHTSWGAGSSYEAAKRCVVLILSGDWNFRPLSRPLRMEDLAIPAKSRILTLPNSSATAFSMPYLHFSRHSMEVVEQRFASGFQTQDRLFPRSKKWRIVLNEWTHCWHYHWQRTCRLFSRSQLNLDTVEQATTSLVKSRSKDRRSSKGAGIAIQQRTSLHLRSPTWKQTLNFCRANSYVLQDKSVWNL